MIKGVLFDFDGTLANTIDLIVATFEHTCDTALALSQLGKASLILLDYP